MSTSTAYGPPISTYVEFANGTTSSTVLEVGNSVTWTRTDTVRRKRPASPLAEIQQATAVSTQVSYRLNSGFVYYKPATGGVNTYHSAVSKHTSLGYADPYAVFTDSTLTVKLANKLRATSADKAVSLGQMLAEYRQSAKLFSSLAGDVSRLAKAVIRRNPAILFKPRPVWSKTTAREWLRFVYGVTPLAQDMYDSLDLLKKGIESKPIMFRVTESVGRTERKQSTVNSVYDPGFVKVQLDEVWTQRRRGTGFCFANQDLLSNFSVAGFNPVAVAWELIPFSFVVDWWINVGEVLTSLDNHVLFDRITYVESFQSNYVRSVEVMGNYGSFRRDDLGRAVAKTISPRAAFLPKPDISIRHILNGLALLRVLT